MNSGLLVKINGADVGRLWLDEKKIFCFQYNSAWLKTSRLPLSISLPLRNEPYLDDESRPFFANLLPEEKIRSLIARNLGISINNDYGFLERIGGDCAGAVSLYPESGNSNRETCGYRQLSYDDLNQIVDELPQRPLLAGEKGVRLSLAGAQKKLPVYYDDEHFHIGLGSAASNFIIKPPIDNLDGTVENEAFCMALARVVGLDVPRSFIHKHRDSSLFVIQRYDRVDLDGKVRRLHQEDFCQALGISPEFKYESEDGPSLAACFALLRRSSVRAGKDVLALLDWVIYNYLIGNSDAHGKNISLLLLPEGPVLAPFYDQLSTRIYSHYGLAEGLAMKIGGEADPNALQKKHWLQFAEDIGVKPRLVLTRIAAMVKRIEEARLPLFKEKLALYKCDALYRLMELIGEQTTLTLRRVL